MGADIAVQNERMAGGEPVGDLLVRQTTLRGVDVPAERAPSMIDEYPILAVAAALAHGPTRMRGLAELRVKESDRLAATVAMLLAAGARVAEDGDDLVVQGIGAQTNGLLPGGCTVVTDMDHRLAMSALVLGQVTEAPVAVDDGSFIDTSFPDFAGLMRGCGAAIA